jgi:hypothetical protein
MTAEPIDPRTLLAQLLLDWLAARTGTVAGAIEPEADGLLRSTIGGAPLVIAVEPVAGAEPPAEWTARLASFADRIDAPEGGALVWLPPGAEPPSGEPAASAAVAAINTALEQTLPGEADEARLPVRVYIRKREDEGAYVTAYGGLAPYWAQFTDRVQGYYQLDSKELHRPPDDEAELKALVERIVATAQGMEVDAMRAVPAEDTWRVRRLRGGAGAAVLGLPPGDESETGASLRKRIRALLPEAGARLAPLAGALHVLLLYGHYGSMANEPVGAALRGQEPQAFAGIDLVVLAADGAIRPLLDITRHPALQARAEG